MFELSIIVLLLILNGVFAMSEIALVTARRARLQQRAENGDRKAKRALELAANPERFLSTVQVGISLVSVLNGAFGGARLAGSIAPAIARVPAFSDHADAIALGLVVALITYLSLIIGELVPKGLALRHAEQIACAMAGPMDALTRMTRPIVWFLELSTRAVLRLFGKRAIDHGVPTVEEMEVLIRQGIVTGSVHRSESEMVEGVFDLRDLVAEEIMRPKLQVTFLHADDPPDRCWAAVAASSQAVFPVYEKSRDEILGLISLRDLYANAAGGRAKPLRELLHRPIFVADNEPGLSLLATLRKGVLGAGVVTDEFGTVRGLITLEDLVEEVVGELRPAVARSGGGPTIRKTAEDAWLVDGLMEIDTVIETIDGLDALVAAEKEPFQTLAGYIVHRLDRLPEEGESFHVGAFTFEIVDMDRQRIDKVVIRRDPEPAEQGEDAAAAARE